MSLTPATLERIVWGAIPAALFLALRSYLLLVDGSSWDAAAHAVMAALVVATPVLSKGRLAGGPSSTS